MNEVACGVAMDTWMYPLEHELIVKPFHKPLMFINSELFQWQENLKKIKDTYQSM